MKHPIEVQLRYYRRPEEVHEMKRIDVTHRSPAAVGWEGIKRQDEHNRIVEGRRLADRVDRATPPPAPAPPRRRPGSQQGQEASKPARLGSQPPAPVPGPETGSARVPRGGQVIDVAQALQRQEQRRARLAELDRIDAALSRALAEQPYIGQEPQR